MSCPPNEAADPVRAAGPERVDGATALTIDPERGRRVEERVIPLIPDATSEPSPASGNGAPASLARDPATTGKFHPQIVTALSSIFDPEIPVNIYELGLIYEIAVDADSFVEIRMTLTSPGCPAAQILPGQVEQRVRNLPGVQGVRVEVVWDPPWTKERMSDAAKLQLGIF